MQDVTYGSSCDTDIEKFGMPPRANLESVSVTDPIPIEKLNDVASEKAADNQAMCEQQTSNINLEQTEAIQYGDVAFVS